MERNAEPTLGSWPSRIGAALVAPTLALRASDSPEGQGRASGDITGLLLLAIVALKTELFGMAGWMVGDGDYSGAITVVMVGAREHLIMPILLLLGGSLVLTVLAGRKRSLAKDFDLACVALTPLVVIEIAHALIGHAGLDAHTVSVVVGYTWSALILVLALRQARGRMLNETEGGDS